MEKHIEQMAENNFKVLKEHHLDSYIDSPTKEKSIEGGDLFLQEYLTPDQFNLFKDSADLEDTFDIRKELELVDEILKNDICLITIRPEMRHYTDRIREFLEEKDLIPIYTLNHKLNSEQYWDIYHRGITNPNARNTMSTRTLVYTSSEVTTIIFKNSKKREGLSSADYIFNKFKGDSGRYLPNTLRGDLVREEAKRIGLGNLEMDSLMALAIDPFAAYRNILREKQISEDDLLAYTAVSVHIPSQKELGRDLSVLLNSDQLKSVISNLNE